LAPIAWNFAGDWRNSLISSSSSIASSAPATSAKLVLGVSLVISLARDLPKFITREPPPCIWFMNTKKSRKITMKGSHPSSTLSSELPCGLFTL
jgi:hypothetical protein